jgi:hypothetical protein
VGQKVLTGQNQRVGFLVIYRLPQLYPQRQSFHFNPLTDFFGQPIIKSTLAKKRDDIREKMDKLFVSPSRARFLSDQVKEASHGGENDRET